MERHDRLKAARVKRGFASAKEAARFLGVPYGTYSGHEAGSRGIKDADLERYAKAFRVPLIWLALGEGGITGAEMREVPLVGFVGAGAAAHYYADAQGPFDMVPAPDGATDSTVAVEVRGESLGPLFDRWLVFYDDVRSPVTSDLIGRLCVVGLPDDRVLVKKLQRARSPGLYHLLSNTEPTMTDVEVAWAAKVRNMVPR